MVKIALLCAGLFLASCAAPAGSFCDIAEPIRPTAESLAAMSDAEVRAALRHNRIGAELCGWQP